jgi:CubicO group peptidase (beta-lactamase class C family)
MAQSLSYLCYWLMPMLTMLRFLVFIVISMLYGCRFGRMAIIQMPGQHDFKLQASQRVSKGDKEVFQFYRTSASEGNRIANLRIPDSKNLKDSLVFEKILKRNHVAACMLIKNDSILYSQYFGGYSPDRYFTSFSVAKSFVVTLLGIAISEGHITSEHAYLTKWVPELKGKQHADSVRLIHLLEHRSGIRFREIPFNPFGRLTALYHRRHQIGVLKNMRWDRAPNTRYEYQDINTFLLGLIIERATGMPLQTYLESRLWSQLGMQADAFWSSERANGMVKPYCCLQTQVEDLARFGRLYLHKGQWQGRTIVPQYWIERATYCDDISDDSMRPGRPWHWQTGNYPDCDFNARGLYDQFIYVNPSKNVVLVMISDKHYITRISWRELFRRLCKDYL